MVKAKVASQEQASAVSKQQNQHENKSEKSTASSSVPVPKDNDKKRQNGNGSISPSNPKEKSDTSVEECQLGDEKPSDTDKEKKDSDQELVFIHDAGFNIKIQAPGQEPFDVQVSSMELVQEIHHLLMDREDTCHRTCFSLQLDGNSLDNFSELKAIEGLKEGSLIKVVEEPYTMREARIHVRHVRDLLKSLDTADAYLGTECSSLSFLNVVCQGYETQDRRAAAPSKSASGSSRAGVSSNSQSASGGLTGDFSVDCTPPDHVLPLSKDRPLLPLHPLMARSSPSDQANTNKGPPALKVLTMSGWNPPPAPRKLHGDLMYLYVVTLEEKPIHITSSTRGFYVNLTTSNPFLIDSNLADKSQSSIIERFDPRPAQPKTVYHSLIDLLSNLSPAFKRAFNSIQKRRHLKHPFERVATPYQVYQWASPLLDHSIDSIRAEDAFSAKLGYEEHIPGQTRDWNEELQTTRELARKTLPERLLRERAVFKVHGDFVAAATRGACAVIDGNVMAINPGEETKMQMFIWNNIFFSLGFDVRDHYKELGGDAAAYAAPISDLQGVRAYAAVDLEGLYTLGTVVVDYRGFRVTAQSIIPGILEREQDQSVVYGSVDFGKTCSTHPKYLELLNQAGQQLKILPHQVVTEEGKEIEICSSVECKGIIGNDGRHYILDLLRTFPPDVNFLPDVLVDHGEELSSDVGAMGFPRQFAHKLTCLRQELIEAFFEQRYLLFIKLAAYHIQQAGLKSVAASKQNSAANSQTDSQKAIKDTEEAEEIEKRKKEIELEKELRKANDPLCAPLGTDSPAKDKRKKSKTLDLDADESDPSDEYKKLIDSLTAQTGEKEEADATKEIVRKAATAVGSLKDTEFDVRFNPDVYSPVVKHPTGDDHKAALKRQRQLVKDAAEFLLINQIPNYIKDCLDHTITPFDGITLTESLHGRGINMRYLGRICTLLSQYKSLHYLHTIAVTEVITRAVKHLFNSYVQSVETMSLSPAIAHFLNCLLSSCSISTPNPNSDELVIRSNGLRRGKGKGRRNMGGNRRDPLQVQDNLEWLNLDGKSLWTQIRAELESYYGLELRHADSIDLLVEKYDLQKMTLLRSVSLKCGIQIQLREYNFDHKSKPPFLDDDIVSLFPVVKHIHPRATDAFNFYTTGQTKIQQGYLKEGYELISEALNLLNNVYGAMHPEIAQCLRLLARLNYIMGDYPEAMATQQKALIMSEKVNGIDHPYTITEYTHLALYCFANSQVTPALRLLYRARYLLTLVSGENHPEMATIDSNIGLILHAVSEFDLSYRFLEHALKLNVHYFGARSLKTAVSHHLCARTQSCQGDFRSALHNEKETFTIYKSQLGETHEKTRESADCLRHLTQQAVVLQKRINEIHKGKTTVSSIPPIQIQPPSLSAVLDMLNIINGILFVHINAQDIEALRAEAAAAGISGHGLSPAKSNAKAILSSTENSDEAAINSAAASADPPTAAKSECVPSEIEID